jgi:Holliday junction resolvase RusA-like endonuclease
MVIPGEPCAQGRPRFARRGKFVVAFDPAKSRNWKATAQALMQTAMGTAAPMQGPLSVDVAATFTCPKGDHRKTPRPRRWHAKRPDAENVVKAVLDAATGVLWLDDSQVARLVVVKAIGAQGEAPRVWLRVRPIMEEPA